MNAFLIAHLDKLNRRMIPNMPIRRGYPNQPAGIDGGLTRPYRNGFLLNNYTSLGDYSGEIGRGSESLAQLRRRNRSIVYFCWAGE